MEFIDTHCHIYYDKYQDDINEVISRANNNNVNNIICVGVDIESSKKSLFLYFNSLRYLYNKVIDNLPFLYYLQHLGDIHIHLHKVDRTLL